MPNIQPSPQKLRQRARPRPRPMPRETGDRKASPRAHTPEVIVDNGPQPDVASIRRAGIASIQKASLTAIPANTVGQVSQRATGRPEDRSLAEARRYARPDLYAVAELGHQYLFSGGLGVAEAIFEGLHAVAPQESYFAMALGLVRTQQGRLDEAERLYATAGRLDPMDGRPDVNRAELKLQKRDMGAARQLLSAGAQKSRRRGDHELQRKADALLARISAR
ncbi:MAG: hypothetical protein AAF449_01000 [Myxococcota bacterium]